MTLYLYLRTRTTGGDVIGTPYLLSGDGTAASPAMRSVNDPLTGGAAGEVLFAAHGFNVSYAKGLRALGALEAQLVGQGFAGQFVGVLWPGDFWLPAVNYPWAFGPAVQSGRRVAAFADTRVAAPRVSFLSHSLGGRVVLEALANLRRRAHQVCLMAAAVDDNCLSIDQYRAVVGKAERIAVLASKSDKVLRLAYRTGDLLSDLFRDRDSPWRDALGFHGPRPAAPGVAHAQIPADQGHDHGDYFPPSDLSLNARGARAARFAAAVLARGPADAWPHGDTIPR